MRPDAHQSPKTLVVAGCSQGSGKTLVTLALAAAYAARGQTVRVFKSGPLRLDLAWAERLTGATVHNLDAWIMGPDAVLEVFSRHASGADICLVDGVGGLHDGVTGADPTGGDAHLAGLLAAPVLLVLNAQRLGRSAAAVARGLADGAPALAGLVANRVLNEDHALTLAECLDRPDTPTDKPVEYLGHLPLLEQSPLPRGFTSPGAASPDIGRLAAWAEERLDLNRLYNRLPLARAGQVPGSAARETVARIGVAADAAFAFGYAENRRILEAAGAELVPFSPLTDQELPRDLDGLYFPAGPTELFAAPLGENTTLRKAVHAFGRRGLPVYAEGGGFTYLLDGLERADGELAPLCGLFNAHARLEDGFCPTGYREVVTTKETILGQAWTMLRGHETRLANLAALDGEAEAVYTLRDQRGWLAFREGFTRYRVLGSHVQTHFASNPEAAAGFVAACRARGRI